MSMLGRPTVLCDARFTFCWQLGRAREESMQGKKATLATLRSGIPPNSYVVASPSPNLAESKRASVSLCLSFGICH